MPIPLLIAAGAAGYAAHLSSDDSPEPTTSTPSAPGCAEFVPIDSPTEPDRPCVDSDHGSE